MHYIYICKFIYIIYCQIALQKLSIISSSINSVWELSSPNTFANTGYCPPFKWFPVWHMKCHTITWNCYIITGDHKTFNMLIQHLHFYKFSVNVISPQVSKKVEVLYWKEIFMVTVITFYLTYFENMSVNMLWLEFEKGKNKWVWIHWRLTKRLFLNFKSEHVLPLL